jgi:hypothetical protein
VARLKAVKAPGYHQEMVAPPGARRLRAGKALWCTQGTMKAIPLKQGGRPPPPRRGRAERVDKVQSGSGVQVYGVSSRRER